MEAITDAFIGDNCCRKRIGERQEVAWYFRNGAIILKDWGLKPSICGY